MSDYIHEVIFREFVLAPFYFLWEWLPPRYAIPVMTVLAFVLIYCFVNFMIIMFSNTESEPEPGTDSEWQFHPEDFEQ